MDQLINLRRKPVQTTRNLIRDKEWIMVSGSYQQHVCPRKRGTHLDERLRTLSDWQKTT
jgi:hypothetical protein